MSTWTSTLKSRRTPACVSSLGIWVVIRNLSLHAGLMGQVAASIKVAFHFSRMLY